MPTPYMLRWLNAVAYDESLSYRAKSVAGLSIFRHADMKDGANCKVGIPKMAMETGLGQTTVKLGLAELEGSGYLRTSKLPRHKWNVEGSLRFPSFPGTQSPGDSVPSRPAAPGRPLPTHRSPEGSQDHHESLPGGLISQPEQEDHERVGCSRHPYFLVGCKGCKSLWDED